MFHHLSLRQNNKYNKQDRFLDNKAINKKPKKHNLQILKIMLIKKQLSNKYKLNLIYFQEMVKKKQKY